MVFSNVYAALKRLSYNAVFLAAVAILILGLFIMSNYQAYKNSQHKAAQSVKIDVEHQTRAVAASIEEYLRGKQDVVLLMANYLLVQEYLDRVRQDTIESDPHYTNLCSLLLSVGGLHKDIAIAWIASLRDEYSMSYDDISYGDVSYYGEDAEGKEPWVTSARDWFSGSMGTEDIFFSDPYIDFETGEVCVSLIKKVYVSSVTEELVGFAGLDLFFPPVRKILKGFAHEDVCYPILVSNDGSILYHPKEEYIFQKTLGDLDPALEQFRDGMRRLETATHLITLDQGRNPVYFGYMPIQGTSWSIGIIWKKHDAENTLTVFEQTLLRAFLFNLLLFLLPTVFFGYLLTQRSRQFRKMRRLYDTVVNQMQTGIAVIDPKTDKFILQNPAYESFLGTTNDHSAPFSVYRPSLNISDSDAILHATSGCTLLAMDNTPKTKEILLPLENSAHYFTHNFFGFRDYEGYKLLLSVLTDVTELKKMQETLREARDVAESANRAKSAFLANMSHEMRTPMNGIIGITELLASSNLDAQQQEYIEIVRNSADALLTVINDILEHSHIEAGKLLIETYSFDLHSLIQELSLSFSHSARQKEIDFQTTVSPDVPQFVHGDANRLRQILNIFLNNAVKFTAESGKIELNVFTIDDVQKPNHVRFEICDTGIGITDSQIQLLFKPFEQADSSSTRKFGGTGLGLSLSRRLMQLMGGETGCTSEYGTGSVFWCELPLPASSGLLSGILPPS